MLYLVPTPIGNLKDITLRALETLKEVEAIICEDTRRTSILLNHYQVKKPLIVLNDFNEFKTVPQILERLSVGQSLALVSDAGTPLISDPGYKLVRACLESNIVVESLPGPTSVITALTLSGLPPDKFLFLGYLPEKPKHRQDMIKSLTKISHEIKLTYIIFVAPHKLLRILKELKSELGNIEIVLAREMTKIHQEVKKYEIDRAISEFSSKNPKGEFILLISL
ncbi:MAG: 16S rRNA (cytidine(1402)-2'-O)-methyltransferase [Candidatus Daviesbacteria bacterium]|nr:16S rRNA (cytidine(1402)-2'-O)-methyltransferase [Candidatus Daviesbacteria bacterium]